MKITALYGAMPNFDYGMGKVTKIIYDILSELGDEINEVNLAFTEIPYYDGVPSESVIKIMNSIKESQGVIFACTANSYAPSAVMQSFIEYLSYEEYNHILQNKNCLVLNVSKETGERNSLEYLSKVINECGGFDSVKIGLSEDKARNIDQDTELHEIVEKQVEDYYRLVRQNRKFIIPKGDKAGDAGTIPFDKITPIVKHINTKPKVSVTDVYTKLNLDDFSAAQEKDIQDITQLFTKKYEEPKEVETMADLFGGNSFQMPSKNVTARQKTCKQLTQSLAHHFQPQLSSGLKAVVQVCISGTESFEGYFDINSSECEYVEGQASMPDITILADTSIWTDILKGKHTAQKSFMIGQLKVRGNFVLLPKFDQIFKFSL